jgi:hypothetical protein
VKDQIELSRAELEYRALANPHPFTPVHRGRINRGGQLGLVDVPDRHRFFTRPIGATTATARFGCRASRTATPTTATDHNRYWTDFIGYASCVVAIAYADVGTASREGQATCSRRFERGNHDADTPTVTNVLPDRARARKAVFSLATFWAAWGISVIGYAILPPLGVIAIVVGFLAGFRFWAVLFRIEQPERSESIWRVLFTLRLTRPQTRSSPRLFRPTRFRQIVQATGWQPKLVGSGLLAILLGDLVVAIAVFPHALH